MYYMYTYSTIVYIYIHICTIVYYSILYIFEGIQSALNTY